MQTLHTAAIHKLLSTPVSLDLGSTARDIIVTRDRVTELPKVVADAIKPTQDGITALRLDMTRDVGNAVTTLKDSQSTAISAARNDLQQKLDAGFKQVLAAISQATTPAPAPTPAPSPTPPLAVTKKSELFVRWLTQVQTLAVDAKPGQPDKQVKNEWGENVQLQNLLALAEPEARQHLYARPDLQKRFLDAFARFNSVDLAVRSVRYAEVHALIPEITAHLG